MKKYLPLSLAALTILGAVLCFIVFQFFRIDDKKFHEAAGRLIAKLEILNKRAHVFDEKKALDSLGPNILNAFYYRFDEHLSDAKVDSKHSQSGSKTGTDLHSFEFETSDAKEFRAGTNQPIMANGYLKFSHSPGDYLFNSQTINIAKDKISRIEIRMKVRKSSEVDISLEHNYEQWQGLSKQERRASNHIVISIPDNEFHTYTIQMQELLHKQYKPGELVQNIFIWSPRVGEDEMEVDFIRLVLKNEKYRKMPVGESYETIDQEMRKVIYLNTPCSLNFPISLPSSNVSLSFGIGILEENDPVLFRVLVEEGAAQHEVFSRTVLRSSNWEDVKIDLTRFSGRSIKVVFRAASANTNVAFLSNPILYSPPAKQFNVIMILEDTLRADHLSAYGYGRHTSPQRDKFFKRGAVFENAFSQAPTTRSSCPTFMTSLYFSAIGTWIEKVIPSTLGKTRTLNDRYLTLAEVLRSQGFSTGSFIQNYNVSYDGGLHQGFDSILTEKSIGNLAETMYGPEVQRWITDNKDRNFFLYLHLIDPHAPREPEKLFKNYLKDRKLLTGRLDDKKDLRWIGSKANTEIERLLYDGEIRYNDFHFGKFIRKLEKDGILENTLVIFLSDHGEHLGEHGLWGHNAEDTGRHGCVYGTHVPLAMVYPSHIPENTRLVQPVQMIDIMPTILDFAAIDQKELLIAGNSLISLIQGRDMEFWDHRLVITEDALNSALLSRNNWMSILYQDKHFVNSYYSIRIAEYMEKRFGIPNFPEFSIGSKAYNYLTDKDEAKPLLEFSLNLGSRLRISNVMNKIRNNNLEIMKSMNPSFEEDLSVDPEIQERLKSLGYLN